MAFFRKNILQAGFIVFAFLLFGNFSQNAAAIIIFDDGQPGGGAQPSPTSGSCASGYTCESGCFAPSIQGAACAGGVCCKPGPSAGGGSGSPMIPTSSCNYAYCKSTPCSVIEVQDTACQASTCTLGGYYCVLAPSGGGSGAPNPQSNSAPNPQSAASSQPINFTNPLAFNTVEQVLDSILGTLRGIIVILALVFLVIGAVLYITSAGNDGRMKTAKGAITAAMIGLAIGLAAPSFLKEIGTVLGWGAVNSTAVAGAATLSQIATSVLNFLLSIVGVLAIIMLVVGAIMYLTAAGSEDQIDSGKKIVKYSIIGIITALAALVIVSQIAAFFV